MPVVIRVFVRSRVPPTSQLLLSSLSNRSMRAERRRGRVATITHCVDHTLVNKAQKAGENCNSHELGDKVT